MPIFGVFAFVWGALWGSFLNVVIYRLPREMSLIRPGSHCPRCSAAIRWYDNIPLVSWIVLRGRCRHCKASISWRYPAIELVTAGLSLLLFLKCAQGRLDEQNWPILLVPFLFYFFFICAAIAISVIDLETTLIPDVLTIPTALLGVLAAVAIPESGRLARFHPALTWSDSLIGLLTGAVLFFAIYYGYRLFTGRVGMGGGDVTMAAMIGAWLGYKSWIFVLFLASFQGVLGAVVASVVERLKGRRSALLLRGVHRPEFWEEPSQNRPEEDLEVPSPESEGEVQDESEPETFGKIAVPFGPFLALAAIEYLFLGRLAEQWLMGGL